MKSFSRLISIISSLMMMSTYSFANVETSLRPQLRPGSGDVQAASASEQALQNAECAQLEQMTVNACSGNPALMNANSGLAAMQLFQQGGTAEAGNGKNAQEAERVGLSSQASLAEARKQCRQTFNECKNKCQMKYDAAWILKNNEMAKTIGQNATVIAQADKDMMEARTTTAACQKESQQSLATTGMKMGEIAQLLQAVAQILQALGIGSASEGQEVAEASVEDEDECAATDLTPECAGQSDPLGSRAGTGATGIASLNGQKGKGLFGQAEDGEPGGDDKSSGAKSAGARNGGGAGGAGFGSFGAGSSGSGAGGSSVGKAGLDTNIHKGYMSGGGSGGGGGFGSYGGGGGSSRSSRSGSFGRSSSASAARGRLQSALNRVANNGGRGIASSEGTKNGPFQNIWGVMNKMYKKTSPSMYHGE